MKKFLTFKSFVILLPFIGAGIALVAFNILTNDQTISLALAAAVFFLIIGARFWIEGQTPRLAELAANFAIRAGYNFDEYVQQSAPIDVSEHYKLARFFIEHSLSFSRHDDATGVIYYKYKRIEVAAVHIDGWHIIRAGIVSARPITDLNKVKKALVFVCAQVDNIAGTYEKAEQERAAQQAAADKARQQAQQQKQQQPNNNGGGNNGNGNKQNGNGKQNPNGGSSNHQQWQQGASIVSVPPQPNANNNP